MSKNSLKTILAIILVGIFVYVFYRDFGNVWAQLYSKYFPCRSAIVYNLGSLDSKFGVSKKDFLDILAQAEAVWEKPVGRELFTYKADDSSKSVLKINLIYDSRQQATEKMRALGLVVSDTRASYDNLRAKYTIMQKSYLQAKSDYQSKSTDFKNRQGAYFKKVEYWNDKGGAPKGTYEELKAEEAALKAEFALVQKMEGNLNSQVDDINALVNAINKLARTLNINVSELNNIGEKRGEEFTEGEYKEGSSGREIDIYEFSTKAKLKRVLSHELGHALGLEHVDDPEAIMYYLNESKNGKLATTDLSALKSICKIK